MSPSRPSVERTTTPCTSFSLSPPVGVPPPCPSVDDFGSGIGEISLTLPDGSVRKVSAGTTGADLAMSISPRLAKAALAVVVDDRLTDLTRPFEADARVRIITERDPEALAPLSPQHGAPAGGGGPRAVPGHPVRDRPGHRRRLLLRLRRAAALRPRGSAAHRAADARDRGARPALRPGAAGPGGRQGVLRRPRRAAEGRS